ncbi:NADH:ferredoxin oxidoreductase CtmF [Castellaniella defragrans 65Phen]|uniref:Probable ferredoxin reductase CtmF n=1 Tax=Castellaniella defragrans (strain DSM 12143 / CCUG 39792 / 65Phen) TaxID=1437824 RepID=CTMF_CASD6|nr:FAD-dependent oxidoreductase [Castellaniella defragrans]W8X9R5.1 RecName: Full=Probable ferredoxin reductase CtmF [Castellaniella defragrans 65Phen]CDM25285.1 NADH:ferredoxin oxidoreductase CtmF [Castellaniella defragrans 65Phen]
MNANERVIIVGAGHAGATVAMQLRKMDFAGDIILLGDERFSPYQRPPLSKAYLAGEEDAESLKLWPDEIYESKGIMLVQSATVAALDRAGKYVRLADKTEVSYDCLVIATGSRPREIALPGIHLAGVHRLHTIEDADGLKAAIGPGKRVALVGGGYIGLEVAASVVGLGGSAVVIEQQDRVLAGVASVPLSDYLRRAHEDRGVEFLTGVQVARIEGSKGRVTGIRLGDDRLVPCDAAVVCVGVVPNTGLAVAAGLDGANGIVVDHDARTADPAIFAIGDVTCRPMPLYDDRMFCLRSVPNALEQAKQAAAAMMGKPRPKPEVPWFWSHQFDLKVQIAGVPFDADDLVLRGDPAAGAFSAFHMKDGRVLAVETVDAPLEFAAGKQMILRKSVLSREQLVDPRVEVTALAV